MADLIRVAGAGMIQIGKTATGEPVSLPLKFANRHGLVTGATGTGKTVTLQRLAEEFSKQGVPVFAADIKGDLSGIAAKGDPARFNVPADKFPVALWDIFGEHGLPIRTSVHQMGATLLAAMLQLNETQAGTLAIAFKKCADEGEFLLTLDDARWLLNEMAEDRETISKQYGNVTGASVAAIQRAILTLEGQSGANLFGEPAFSIADLMRVENGRGVVNLLHADQLMSSPRTYAIFLFWLLTELFRELPEVGDVAKPRLVFFFDESHLLFNDSPKPLLQQIERLVRLVRSKGVGVYFVTQSPADVPDIVLSQLGNRVQHALRAFTPSHQRMIRAAANAFRPNPGLDIKAAITDMATGEALVSVMESDGVPSVTQRVRVCPPAAQVGPISKLEREVLVSKSPMRAKYGRKLDADAMQQEFTDRMRAANGLPPLERYTGPDAYQPGDWVKFIPNIILPPENPPRRSASFVPPLCGLVIAAVCFKLAGLF
jgi:DNA helicase HerA-like ATPase